MTLRQAWNQEADNWVRYARDPGRDVAFWSYHLAAFMDLLPPPVGWTVDIGCGEGRLARALVERGHRVVGVDTSPGMARAARSHDEPVPVLIADASALPFDDASFDLAVLFMVLHDVDDMDRSVAEAARVVARGGRVCLAITHPLQGIGEFSGSEDGGRYVLNRPYFGEQRLTYWSERDGTHVAFHFMYSPLSAYTSALESAGLLIESLREPMPPEEVRGLLGDMDQRLRVPAFLHISAVRPSG